ncbi:MAG: GTPase HflX [Planctomycetota bacterium]|jgi:GTP-binding protein HflX
MARGGKKKLHVPEVGATPQELVGVSGERRARGERERAILAGCRKPSDVVYERAPLEELAELADTAGADVAARLVQRRDRFVPATLFGKGKVEEIAGLAREHDAGLVITENDCSPAQVRNLEKVTGCRVVDRTELILDIFALNARTQQARLAVELAQLQYLLPRLRRMWTHLERIEGGIGMRGPGETQLETDRRIIRKKIDKLRATLTGIEAHRRRTVAAREGEFTVSLVGYTNAGKSTLMRRLTGADVHVEDRLFATLDTRSRVWRLPGGGKAILSDTVGFIRRLPPNLIASFHATLEEALHADLVLHVADASHPDVEGHITTVEEVLDQIGAGDRPRLLVLNKLDLVDDHLPLAALREARPERLEISAVEGTGCDALGRYVSDAVIAQSIEAEVVVPYADGQWLAALRANARILEEEMVEEGTRLLVRVPRHHAALLRLE